MIVDLQLDNKSICTDMKQPGLRCYQSNESRWVSAKFNLHDSRHTLDAISLLLQRGAMREIYDFDNYLDDVEKDWSNQHLNLDLKQILSMH